MALSFEEFAGSADVMGLDMSSEEDDELEDADQFDMAGEDEDVADDDDPLDSDEEDDEVTAQIHMCIIDLNCTQGLTAPTKVGGTPLHGPGPEAKGAPAPVVVERSTGVLDTS